ncbi:hypothetical protein [Sphingomonas sp. CFBP 13720]|uniref:hypothetical protein n=1 Tax=Sphingomonas sp. CFBP 13720 TaxID=2775302 RepID=UPI00177B281C|nr:hypothetical protein [Sphingomonas sp. CFBP 13720]MBD8678313.1 hypothetical protein [Sphingomonas sp. CFBP 13720]
MKRTGIAVFICAILFLHGCGPAPLTAQEEVERKNAAFEEIVATSVRAAMLDPGSTELRFESVFPDEQVACGKTNSKNAFGGYVGFSGFSYDKGIVWFETSNQEKWLAGLRKCTDAYLNETLAKNRVIVEELKRSSVKSPQMEQSIKSLEADIQKIERTAAERRQ